MRFNKYFPFAFIYFFVNSLALPFGLTYTALLAPLFYIWIILVRKKEILLPFIILLTPFLLIHLTITGVEMNSYFISLLNLLLVYIFCQAVYTFLIVCKDIEKIFRRILVLNFIVCLLAIPLYFTPYFNWVWMEQELSVGVNEFRRLKLFTYEPSYYALLFTPLFFYFLLQYLFRQHSIRPGALLLAMLLLPYILSFSIGVIGAVLLAMFIVWIVYFRKLTSKRRIFNAIINTGVFISGAMVVLVLFFRNNPLFTRFSNIFSGLDTSGKGRTTDAFIIAGKLLGDRNEWWGIGLGQIKIAGEVVIRDYYLYFEKITIDIPNAVAETLAIFGIVGLALRFGLEIFFFFYTRVWTNYYRLLLFLFVFIYQFTGSFITNVAEYVIWVIAFTGRFNQFDVKTKESGFASRG